MVIDDNQPSHISILIKFERVNRRYRALNSLAGFACLIFWMTQYEPRNCEIRPEVALFENQKKTRRARSLLSLIQSLPYTRM